MMMTTMMMTTVFAFEDCAILRGGRFLLLMTLTRKPFLFPLRSIPRSPFADKMDYFARDERRAMGEAGKVDKLMIEDACVAYGECTIVGCKREHRTNKDGKKVHLMIW